VMLTAGDPGLKLLDFGIARLAGDASEPQLTSDGQVIGTPDYLAPEQLLSPNHVDGRIDVYSLGLVLYWVLAGQLPHRSRHPAARAVLDALPIQEFVPSLEPELAALVMASLAREPEGRPSSALLAHELAIFADRFGAAPLPVLAAKWVATAREMISQDDITRTVSRGRGDVSPGSATRRGLTPRPGA